MQRFRDNILIMGSNGLIPYSGSTVAVYQAGTSTLASIYPSNDPAGAKENPFRAGDYGEIDFYAQNGRYDLLLSRQGYQSLRITDLQIWDPANSDFVTDVDVDGMIAGKADITYVDSELLGKADITYVDQEVAGLIDDVTPAEDKTYSSQKVSTDLAAKVSSVDLANDTDPAKGAAVVGTVQPVTGAVGRTQAEKNSDVVSIKDFGAKGDNVTDDTAAIDAALDYASTSQAKLLIPKGRYRYNGAGHPFPGTTIIIEGAGAGVSVILLGPGCRLVDTAAVKAVVHICGITVSGGAGLYRSTHPGVNVSGNRNFFDCIFLGYTECVIDINAEDSPNVRVLRNRFIANSSVGTIGVALNRRAVASVIAENDFFRNEIHIKCRSAGRGVAIRDNSFLRSDNYVGTPRTDIWLVTNTLPVLANDGMGCVITSNRFGDEYLVTGDFRILYAPESATGQYNGEKFPDLSAAGTEAITGANIYNNSFYGTGNWVDAGLVYTTTCNLRGLNFAENQFHATAPRYLLEYKDPTAIAQWPTATNRFADNISFVEGLTGPIETSNAPHQFTESQQSYFSAGDPQTVLPVSSGANDKTDFVELFSSKTSGIVLLGGGTKTATINDATGDTNQAASVSLPLSAAVGCTLTEVNIKPGFPAWIEFDLRKSGVNPPEMLEIRSVISGLPDTYFLRKVMLTDSWTRYRFPFKPPQLANIQNIFIQNTSPNSVTFDVGRIRVYHAREPITWGRVTFEQIDMSSLPTSATGLASGSLWVDAAAGHVVKRAT